MSYNTGLVVFSECHIILRPVLEVLMRFLNSLVAFVI